MTVIDLSHPIRNGSPAFPGDPLFEIQPWSTIEENKYRLSKMSMGTHQGTHLDAFSHYLPQGLSIDQIALDRLCGPAVRIPLPAKPSQLITEEDLGPFESLLQPEAKVILDTGWHTCYGKEEFYACFPSLTLDACRYLASRGITLLGMDIPSPSLEHREAHQILQSAGIVLVESLANLDKVPDSFLFCAFPLRIVGGDGSPTRAVALV